MKFNKFGFVLVGLMMIHSCHTEEVPIEITSNEYYSCVDLLTQIMVHDIFSPPVASRIYVYPNIAAFEIIAQGSNTYNSLSGQLTDLKPIPKAINKAINLKVAALVAHLELSKELVFSEETVIHYRDSIYRIWNNANPSEFKASEAYGQEVAHHIKEWIKADNYSQTRTMHKYNVDTNNPSRWQPTPPAYMDGIEPHWSKMRTLVLDSASQFKPLPPPEFSLENDSEFYKDLLEVYTVRNEMTEKGDTSQELAMAQFWDCNPYVTVTRGHLMFATKKITPGAHWMGIAKIACKHKNYSVEESIYALTKTSISMFDGFISCWDEKYRSNLIRPETLINQHLDENWTPVLQTPPFPEYPSGHSVVSGAASTVLTSIFGNDFAFDDDTEIPYGLPIRNFASFNAAAEEAAISRLYGGIHYRAAIEEGLEQGREIGSFVVNHLKMK